MVKAWSIRMPDELLEWLREKAAKETIKRKRNVSINSIMVEILTMAMDDD
jgi:predicted DNA-binding protein